MVDLDLSTIFYCPYQLPWPPGMSRCHPNEGVLLCIETPNGKGYADFHPWPSLGDDPWIKQIESLKSEACSLETLPASSEQLRISLQMALDEAEAQVMKAEALLCNDTILNYHLALQDDMIGFQERLFSDRNKSESIRSVIKWKLSPQTTDAQLQLISALAVQFPHVRWRLDANALLQFEQIESLWLRYQSRLEPVLDYVEDPCPYDQRHWNRLADLGLPIAIDFEVDSWLNSCLKSATPMGNSIDSDPPPPIEDTRQLTFIFKPAVQTFDFWPQWTLRHQIPLVFTSYLDHPIGVLHGLWRVEKWLRARPQETSRFQNTVHGFNISIPLAHLKTMGLDLEQKQHTESGLWSWGTSSSSRLGTSNAKFGIGQRPYLESQRWIPLI